MNITACYYSEEFGYLYLLIDGRLYYLSDYEPTIHPSNYHRDVSEMIHDSGAVELEVHPTLCRLKLLGLI